VGQRAFALHRRDLGREQFVVHGDLAHLGFQPGDFVVAVIPFAFFQGCSRTCKRAIAPLGQPGDRDIRLPGYQVQRLTAQQSRNDRQLALNGKTLGAIPVDARRDAYASLGERSGAPSGLRPSSFVMGNTPVEVNLPQPGVSIIRAAPQNDIVGSSPGSVVFRGGLRS